MKNEQRSYPLFSACGLNCGLCPRYHTDGTSRCPGCGGKDFFANRPSCGIVSCNRRHGIEYCFQCDEYPCERYNKGYTADSFITYRNVRKDFDKARNTGIEAYQAELNEKVEILQELLNHYNDGRRKSFFCLAVNVLELQDIRQVMAQLKTETQPDEMSDKERAAMAVGLFEQLAGQKGIELKLKKK